jgi:hypothetical protein
MSEILIDLLDAEHTEKQLRADKREKQTIVISKEVAKTAGAARKMAMEFIKKGENLKEADETGTSFRFRVREPGMFMEKSFRTFQPKGKPGVSIVFGEMK